MEKSEIPERYPVFIRNIDEARRFARNEVRELKGAKHGLCGAEYEPISADVYFDIEPDEQEHRSALLLQGVSAVVCQCLDESVSDPLKLAVLTPGTVKHIGDIFSAENTGFTIKENALLIT